MCISIGRGYTVTVIASSSVLVFVSGEAVFARCLSSLKDERMEASHLLLGPKVTRYDGDKKEFAEHIRKVFIEIQNIIPPLRMWSYSIVWCKTEIKTVYYYIL